MLPDRRTALRSLATFAVVFVLLNLPARGAGHAVAIAASDFANAAIGGYAFGPDIELRFAPALPARAALSTDVDRAWTIVLRAQRVRAGAHGQVALNLRRAFWVPLSVFVALALASPIWRGARGFIVLAIGVVAVLLPSLFLIAIHATGLLYEQSVVDLSDGAQAAFVFGYALLAPPGMVYAVPLLLWAQLLVASRPRALIATGQRSAHN